MSALKTFISFKVILAIAMFLTNTASGQIITLSPSNPSADQEVTITFDASVGDGELSLDNNVYMHHGVVVQSPTSTSWEFTKGNWGLDDGIGKMTKIPGTQKWQFTFKPSLREYFGVPSNREIFKIACVFRSADGKKKGTIAPGTYPWGVVTANRDMYINLKTDDYILLNKPLTSSGFYNVNSALPIEATTNRTADTIRLYVNSGSGFSLVHEVFDAQKVEFDFPVSVEATIFIKAEATFGGKVVNTTKPHQIKIKTPNHIAELPTGSVAGINYDQNNASIATLVLQAPRKSFVHVVGDFNNWTADNSSQMNVTPDGEFFWLTIENLQPQKSYVFQYLVEGILRIGDPYADQVADPWNDRFIEPSVFPNIPEFTNTSFGLATVLKTGQTSYDWAPSETTWERPDGEHLVIYELHIRDFVGSHHYKDLIDTLTYLKRLGVDAIELMPVNEFEGNDSWGYNPSYFFATDKYYGTKEELKKFVETAHSYGIAVILDVVLNHAFGLNPMVRLYFDGTTNQPTAENPWFNREYVGQYQWGYDYNHESTYTKAFLDRVNRYWLEEFHFDGFRFDFTKGFTNYAPGGSVDGYDASRIAILKRMSDAIRSYDPEAYIILEHWAPAAEENVLASYGMKMWRNKSYDFVPAAIGNPGVGSFANGDAPSHVTFYNSHDERRIAEHMIHEGKKSGDYNVQELNVMYERAKMVAAFNFLQPGPKMMWQFDELGYDVHIDFNGRTGRKPLPWGTEGLGYYDDPQRFKIYQAYKAIMDIRHQITPQAMANATKSHKLIGDTRRLSYKTNGGTDLIVIGNFGLERQSIVGGWSTMVRWYDYFSGDSIEVVSPFEIISLAPGEWRVFTNKRISTGLPGVINIVSAEDLEMDAKSCVYPNPFFEMLYLGSIKGQTVIEIFAMDGRMVFDITKETNDRNDIDLSHLPSGVYQLIMKDDDGVNMQRIIKM